LIKASQPYSIRVFDSGVRSSRELYFELNDALVFGGWDFKEIWSDKELEEWIPHQEGIINFLRSDTSTATFAVTYQDSNGHWFSVNRSLPINMSRTNYFLIRPKVDDLTEYRLLITMIRSGGNGLEYIYVDHTQDMSTGFHTLRNQTCKRLLKSH